MKLGDMTVRQLIESANSEFTGLKEHLKLQGLTESEYDALSIDDKFTLGYMLSIQSRLTVLGIRLEDFEKLFQSVRAIVDYNKDDEERDYSEQDEQGREGHIFNHIKAVDDFLSSRSA